MGRSIYRLVVTLMVAGLGYGVGCVGGTLPYIQPPDREKYDFLADPVVMPHHVPEHPGGVSLRFAMVHDILVERFPRHGSAYYRERDRLTREKLAALPADDPQAFDLKDDLAAGLERLGRSDEAVEVMRVKLAAQQAKGLKGRELYTSYANLGTFLIHASFKPALAGDPLARERFREGVGFVQDSVKVNPEAHFGRERWQEAIAEFLLAAMDDPSLLKKFDCLGNRLDLEYGQLVDREQTRTDTGYGRAASPAFARDRILNSIPDSFRSDEGLEQPSGWPEVRQYRDEITKVGAEEGWKDVAVPSYREPVAFDEPVLGIIGMWRQGGGANPHFALALGETMLRVGQRYIAWTAFERASRMAERFWPDPAIQQAFRDHCRSRREQIEQSLGKPSSLLSEFNAELAVGENYQRESQAFEANRIEAGFSIEDEHFFDLFEASHPPIASEPGSEEWFVGVTGVQLYEYGAKQGRVWGLFVGGLAAIGTAWLLNWFGWPRPARRVERSDSDQFQGSRDRVIQ